jgi:hypothetical protein
MTVGPVERAGEHLAPLRVVWLDNQNNLGAFHGRGFLSCMARRLSGIRGEVNEFSHVVAKLMREISYIGIAP